MKKITILLTTLLLTATYGTSAAADSYKYTPYIGADYVFSRANAFGERPDHHGASLRLGSDYGKYFSTELFVTQSGKDKRYSNFGKLSTSYLAYGLDALAVLPVFKNISLIATTGIGEYKYKTKFSPVDRHNEHGYGYRFGGGIKYAFTEHWQARFICRHVEFDHLEGYNHALEYSFGAEYHF